MPLMRKNASWPALNTEDRSKLTSDGGLLLMEALCRRLELWDSFDWGKFPPVPAGETLGRRPTETIIAQLLFSIARGGTTLGEAAMMREDTLLLKLIGLPGAADEAELSAWLSSRAKESVQELRRANAQVIRSALQLLFPVKERAIDLVMRRKCWEFERARNPMDLNGRKNTFLSWRTLAVGPFLLDCFWDTERDDSHNAERVTENLTRHRDLWQGRQVYFSSCDILDAMNWTDLMKACGFSRWTAESDQDTFYRACDFNAETEKRWFSAQADDKFFQQYCWKYPSIKKPRILPGVGLVGQSKINSYEFRFLVVPEETSQPHELFIRHFGAKPVMDEMLADLDLDRHLSLPANAREAYFLIAALAFNLLIACRICLRPDAVNWTTRETIRGIVSTPARLSRTSHYYDIHLGTACEWAEGWRSFLRL